MYQKINQKIDQEIMKLKRQPRIGIAAGILMIATMAASFYTGYSMAQETKKFKTVDNEYAVLYMNEDIAVCSPFTEEQ